MDDIKIKTPEEIEIMAEGGNKLAKIRDELKESIAVGKNASEIDQLADSLISTSGGKASFKMVPGYHWATCINVNKGVVHGIPRKNLVFEEGDIVSVDVGLYYEGFHTDTSFSILLGENKQYKDFLKNGRSTLDKAIRKAVEGNRIYDISLTIEENLEKHGYEPIRALVGHGIGRDLHEDPQIPCFVDGKYLDWPLIKNGMVFAIEVMYALGDSQVEQEADGWTISLVNGKIAGLFEETVAVTEDGPRILTV